MVLEHRPKRLLCLSNGHGEDITTCQILKALMKEHPEVEVAAMPIVGNGDTYRHLGVKIISPTQSMPSGGVFYMNPLCLVKDIWAGLIELTWQQLRVVWTYAKDCDLILATGDIVPAAIAYSTGRPYVVFLCAHSSYYEGQIRLGAILPHLLRSSRCLSIFTRDAFTASDLNRQGLARAKCVGMPVMDMLAPAGKDLKLQSNVPLIALLPGSRLPEAKNNFCLQLQLVREVAKAMYPHPVQFRAALVPDLMAELAAIAVQEGWLHREGRLSVAEAEVICYSDAFADILQSCHLAIGMTGTATEQAVGLGKPVITIPGKGPAFTYRFAEAQQRLLGSSVQVVGTKPADRAILKQAARQVCQTLADSDYLNACIQNGLERMGTPGSSAKIADYLADWLSNSETVGKV